MLATGQHHAAVQGGPDQSKGLSCSCSGVSVLCCGSAKTMQGDWNSEVRRVNPVWGCVWAYVKRADHAVNKRGGVMGCLDVTVWWVTLTWVWQARLRLYDNTTSCWSGGLTRCSDLGLMQRVTVRTTQIGTPNRGPVRQHCYHAIMSARGEKIRKLRQLKSPYYAFWDITHLLVRYLVFLCM